MIKSNTNQTVVSASSSLTYACIAVAANFVTKLAGILMPGALDAILAMQLATMLLVVKLLKGSGWVAFEHASLSRLRAYLPMSLCYGAHAALVLRSLASLNVPIYNTLKRMTPIMVIAAKVWIEGKWPSWSVLLSVLLVVSGCVVAGFGDLTFDVYSYSLALAAAVLQAAYILLAEYASPSSNVPPRIISVQPLSPHRSSSSFGGFDVSKSNQGYGIAGNNNAGNNNISDLTQLKLEMGSVGTTPRAVSISGSTMTSPRQSASQLRTSLLLANSITPALSVSMEAMYYMSATCLPLIGSYALLSGQLAKLESGMMTALETMGALRWLPWFLLTACMEVLLTGSLILCTQTNSALTTTIVGVLKGILAVVLGFFLLGGVGPEGMGWLGITGITMNCAGGVWYAYAKYKEAPSVGKRAFRL